MNKLKSDYLLAQENSQTRFRLVIVLSILFYSTVINFQREIILVASMYLVYSLIIMYQMKKSNKESSVRRFFNIVGDIGTIALAMTFNDANEIVMYPALLWIIIGYGMRFGTKSLLLTLAVAEIAYTYVFMTNPYWMEHKNVVYSLLLGMAAVSMFYILLVKKLHDANNFLEEKVAQRTDEIEHMYRHDSLTGLKNRAALIDTLQKNRYSGLILVDIDNFHNYNELYGMKIGNDVLKKVALLLRNSMLYNTYEAYRIYGDQFILRYEGNEVSEDALKRDIIHLIDLFENFKIDIETLDDVLDIDVTVGAALGNAQVLKMTEMALKHAKKSRKKYMIYSKTIDDTSYSQELLIWKNKIKDALQHDNIVPVYHAIVNKENKIMKYEALIRLREFEGEKVNLISPFFFLEIAVKSKIYPQLTEVMIAKTFRDMKKNGHNFSINLSFDDIINTQIVNMLRSQIRKYAIADQLTFEIVESENIDDFPHAKKFVQEFKAIGIKIAIDDFGTGYSNFTHVLELEPDYVKIDGSLIKNIQHDKKSYELVKSIVNFSKSLGIQTIAEFVSSKEIFEICKNLGIDRFQGYYFSEPLVFEELDSYERKNRQSLVVA